MFRLPADHFKLILPALIPGDIFKGCLSAEGSYLDSEQSTEHQGCITTSTRTDQDIGPVFGQEF